MHVVKSHSAGMGKSLWTVRTGEWLKAPVVTLPLQGTEIDKDVVVPKLIKCDTKDKPAVKQIYHFDIASTV